MSDLPWADVAVGNSEYVKWELPGQELTGTIVDLTLDDFPESEYSEAAQKHVLHVDSGRKVEKVILNLADLTKQLKAAQPRKGDRVKIEFQRVEGKKKLFGVKVQAGPSPLGRGVTSSVQTFTDAVAPVTEEVPF